MVDAAEQLQPIRRQVALKVIRAGFDCTDIVRRFAAERQALAVMEHPGIAKAINRRLTDRTLVTDFGMARALRGAGEGFIAPHVRTRRSRRSRGKSPASPGRKGRTG